MVAIRHEDLWRALDTLAAENGMTPSGLARAAGLDATTFNRSKRRGADGRLRWPSTESLSRALTATGATLEGFTALIRGARALHSGRRERTLPISQLADAAAALFDERGVPAGGAWRREEAPLVADAGDYALRVETDAHAPVLNRGDLAMVSPAAAVEPGDRVLASYAGRVLAGRLLPAAASVVAFGAQANPVPRANIAWMHRITWIGR